jgi:hypothetical protein
MKEIDLNKIKISSLLNEEPIQWGLRGDPFLWDEIRLKTKDVALLENEELMKKYFYNLFKELTGFEISLNENIRIEKYFYGHGMSGGVVCSNFWMTEGFPFILERYKYIIGKITGINYEIKNIYCGSKYFSGFSNSIDSAVWRLFYFRQPDINNLVELLSIDHNIDLIAEDTKAHIQRYYPDLLKLIVDYGSI